MVWKWWLIGSFCFVHIMSTPLLVCYVVMLPTSKRSNHLLMTWLKITEKQMAQFRLDTIRQSSCDSVSRKSRFKTARCIRYSLSCLVRSVFSTTEKRKVSRRSPRRRFIFLFSAGGEDLGKLSLLNPRRRFTYVQQRVNNEGEIFFALFI